MHKRIRRKQIVKCKMLGVKTAGDWLILDWYKQEAELERKVYRIAFDRVWKEWFG